MKRTLCFLLTICLIVQSVFACAGNLLAQEEISAQSMLSPELNIPLLNEKGFGDRFLAFYAKQFSLENAATLKRINQKPEQQTSEQAVFIWPDKLLDLEDKDTIKDIGREEDVDGQLVFDVEDDLRDISSKHELIGRSFGELLLNATRGYNDRIDIFYKMQLYLQLSQTKKAKYLLQFVIVQPDLTKEEWQSIKGNEKKYYQHLEKERQENYLSKRKARSKNKQASEQGGYGLYFVSELSKKYPTYLEYKKAGDNLTTNIVVQIDQATLKTIAKKDFFERLQAQTTDNKNTTQARAVLSSEDAKYMRWIESGSAKDIAPDIATYTNMHNERTTEIIGLKNNVEIALDQNRRLFVTDDEQQVLPFWWKMMGEGVINEQETFLHIDAHLDTLIIQKTNKPIAKDASVREAYDISFTAQESGFLIPAFTSNILDDKASFLMDPRLDLLARQLEVERLNKEQIKQVLVSKNKIQTSNSKFSLVSVDLDALAGLSKEEAYAHLEHIAEICRFAKAITICTSPTYMIDQKAALEYAKALIDLLQQQNINTLQEGVHLVDENILSKENKLLQHFVDLEKQSIPKKFRWDKDKIKQVLKDDNYLKFILVEKGQITGYAVFYLKLNTLARIGVITKNNGNGTRLFNHVVNTIAKQNITSFTVMPLNKAMRFYKSVASVLGFVSFAAESDWILKYNISPAIFVNQAI